MHSAISVNQRAIQIVPYSKKDKGVIRITQLSLIDIRYSYKNFRDGPIPYFPIGWIEGYYADTVTILYYLVPDHESFQIAVDIGLVSNLGIDWEWWKNNIIANGIFYTQELKFYVPGKSIACQMQAIKNLYQDRKNCMETIALLKKCTKEEAAYIRFLYPNIESWDNAVACSQSFEKICKSAQAQMVFTWECVVSRYEYHSSEDYSKGLPSDCLFHYNNDYSNDNNNLDNPTTQLYYNNNNNNSILYHMTTVFHELIQTVRNTDNNTNSSQFESIFTSKRHLFHMSNHELRYCIFPLIELFYSEGTMFPTPPLLICQAFLDQLSRITTKEAIVPAQRLHAYLANCAIPELFGSFYGRIPSDFWLKTDRNDQASTKEKVSHPMIISTRSFRVPSLDILAKAGFSFKGIPAHNKETYERDDDINATIAGPTFCSLFISHTGEKQANILAINALDLRYNYRNFEAFRNSELFKQYSKDQHRGTEIQGYFCDFMHILGFLIPDEPSFDIAVSNKILPPLISLDWNWWQKNILASRNHYSDLIQKFLHPEIGEQTYNQLKYLGNHFSCLELIAASSSIHGYNAYTITVAIAFFHPGLDLSRSELLYNHSLVLLDGQTQENHTELFLRQRIDDYNKIVDQATRLNIRYLLHRDSSGALKDVAIKKRTILSTVTGTVSVIAAAIRTTRATTTTTAAAILIAVVIAIITAIVLAINNSLRSTQVTCNEQQKNKNKKIDGRTRISITKRSDIMGRMTYRKPPVFGDINYEFKKDILEVPIIDLISTATNFNFDVFGYYEILLDMLHAVRMFYMDCQEPKKIEYFSELLELFIGDFNGRLRPGWVLKLPDMNKEELREWNISEKNIPSLYFFDRKGFSIQGVAPRKDLIQGVRVSVGDKTVEMQTISLLDIRLIDFYSVKRKPYNVWVGSEAMKQLMEYYVDHIIKISKLIPDRQSFEIAVKANIIPVNLRISWAWWHREIIQERAKEYENDNGTVDLSKETIDLLKYLDSKFNRVVNPNPFEMVLDKMTNNSPHFVYVSLVLIFTALSLIQVLQGFDVFPSSS
ncbi:hypothetical protein BDA99DRAFT_561528 [Phascolomyces articulosus]|uniref:Uncharacterized protein n=1 Tax=Phascolomyces articulosus TaxID=60185 RepID=A0AAD5K765_9FUNG|nr:hypothetical protein BDA99DRAFT_561528 [Phascolomyces articulosus]